ncbi:MAG: SDR family oxidoreductase [Comamonadaceae bacterium]|nr:MAG: SDR family oxidoreductase [Comamonadaceae bacterium]
MRLNNKTAVVTGGGSGIGRVGALLFAREGANVVVADLNGDAAKETVQLIDQQGGSAIAVAANVATLAGNEDIVAAGVSEYGGVDVYWANAGITTAMVPVADQDIDTFDRIFAVNAKGPWLAARVAMPFLRKREGASFIITASLSGHRARPGNSAYSTSKGAAVMLTRSLAVEFAPDVRVNSISPVSAETPMLPQFMADGIDVEAAIQGMRDGVPLKRLAMPEDVAKAALFLASDDSSFITGIDIPVDGGITARS